MRVTDATPAQTVTVRRLVLEGVPARDRERVAESFRVELARLLREHPVGRPAGPRDRSAPSRPLPPSSALGGIAEAVGRQVAAVVHQRMVRGQGR